MVKKVSVQNKATDARSPQIKWPAIAPPSAPFEVERISADLIVVDGFFSRQTLKLWRPFLATLPMVAPAPGPPKAGYAARMNNRLSVQDQAFAEALWSNSGLKELCETEDTMTRGGQARPLGLNPNIRVYSYEPGHHFGAHYDDDFYDPITRRRSEWTLLIYLTGEEDGVVGGETAFYPDANRKGNGPMQAVPLRAGRALLHRHGNACMLHEGRMVEKGVKWVLRSDVFVS